jgi:protein-L-isoaspartate(D-aspartate) O-methyltransferase
MNQRGIGMTSMRTRERLTGRLKQAGIDDPRVLEAIRNVPRHLFVDEALASRAYEDTALPIGHGQTISQPYVVALMTQILLQTGEVRKVLEVGTGCGYQSAVLARVIEDVYTVERLEPLMRSARGRLLRLGYRNIRVSLADGSWGKPGTAPYDGIIVSAAAKQVPAPLLEQLAPGGRLLIPVGTEEKQDLLLYTRTRDDFTVARIEAANFVPLITEPE